MTDAARTRRKDAVRDSKRAIILEAALRVFARDGLEDASMRAIGEEAGYTAAAIYFHFESKEAIYGELVSRSLDQLIAAVSSATHGSTDPRRRLMGAALAFHDFYAEHPRDLDLGLYLFRGGMRPRGLARDLDAELNDKLLASLKPVEAGARALGASPRAAQAVVADVFAHAVGLLLLEHTGRMKLFGASTRRLMQGHVERIVGELEEKR